MSDEGHVLQGGRHVVLPLITGMVLGSEGLGVLGGPALALVDPAVPVALAALGVLVTFELGAWPLRDGRALASATSHALLAAGLVAAGSLALMPLLPDAPGIAPWTLAAALGVCASASSVLGTGGARTIASRASRIVDLDAIVLIVLGGVTIALVRGPASVNVAWLLFQAAGVTGIVAVTGWLLLSRTDSEIEQRVFGVAVLLLLGGAADYLSFSALLSGFIAGGVWQATGGTTRESISRDLSHVQNPMQVVILVIAGARAELSAGVAILAAAYVLLRSVGKLAAGVALGALSGARVTRAGASRLVSPGILGVAFALNAVRAIGPEMNLVLSGVVVGTLASQLIAGVRDDGAAE